jgi:TfoX/Sxy family transcriptional regulator of competence genes
VDAAERFDAVVRAFARRRGVTTGRMFGSLGLKRDGKTFAMLVKGRLVVKLPRERVEELVAARAGQPFDPGHGRLMREWLEVAPAAGLDWLELAREAHSFLGVKSSDARPPSA